MIKIARTEETMNMRDPTYRVQFTDHRGETAFTNPSNLEDAIDRACGMRPPFIARAIVDERTGDIVMHADRTRGEARRRWRREKFMRHVIMSREYATSLLAALETTRAAQ
jgi:hypothetical protein